MNVTSATAFAVGQRVRVRLDNPAAHCRAPLYTRGRVGVVERHVGTFPHPAFLALPEPVVHSDHLFTVRFIAADLWGRDGHPGDHVHVDLFSLYLEPL